MAHLKNTRPHIFFVNLFFEYTIGYDCKNSQTLFSSKLDNFQINYFTQSPKLKTKPSITSRKKKLQHKMNALFFFFLSTGKNWPLPREIKTEKWNIYFGRVNFKTKKIKDKNIPKVFYACRYNKTHDSEY